MAVAAAILKICFYNQKSKMSVTAAILKIYFEILLLNRMVSWLKTSLDVSMWLWSKIAKIDQFQTSPPEPKGGLTWT